MNLLKLDFLNKKYNLFNTPQNIYNKYSKNIIKNKLLNNFIIKNNKLFNNSIEYISILQKNLLKYNIENYISGGFAFNLYIDTKKLNKNVNNKILQTGDCDLILLYDNELKLNNSIIINNIKYIIYSALDYFKNIKNGILKLFIIINYENKEEFLVLLNTMLKDGFTLVLYNPNFNQNKYIFNFIKIINKNLYIKIEVKFLKMDSFLKNIYGYITKSIYSYCTLNYYSYKYINNNLKIYEKYIPIELLILNKNEINVNIIKDSLIKNNYTLYVYNLKFLIYNLMNLYYNYKYDMLNKGILKKKDKGYFMRDERRLFYILRLYCRINYNITDNNIIERVLINFKLKDYKFKKYMFKIKNTDIIDKIIEDSFIN